MGYYASLNFREGGRLPSKPWNYLKQIFLLK